MIFALSVFVLLMMTVGRDSAGGAVVSTLNTGHPSHHHHHHRGCKMIVSVDCEHCAVPLHARHIEVDLLHPPLHQPSEQGEKASESTFTPPPPSEMSIPGTTAGIDDGRRRKKTAAEPTVGKDTTGRNTPSTGTVAEHTTPSTIVPVHPKLFRRGPRKFISSLLLFVGFPLDVMLQIRHQDKAKYIALVSEIIGSYAAAEKSGVAGETLKKTVIDLLRFVGHHNCEHPQTDSQNWTDETVLKKSQVEALVCGRRKIEMAYKDNSVVAFRYKRFLALFEGLIQKASRIPASKYTRAVSVNFDAVAFRRQYEQLLQALHEKTRVSAEEYNKNVQSQARLLKLDLIDHLAGSKAKSTA